MAGGGEESAMVSMMGRDVLMMIERRQSQVGMGGDDRHSVISQKERRRKSTGL